MPTVQRVCRDTLTSVFMAVKLGWAVFSITYWTSPLPLCEILIDSNERRPHEWLTPACATLGRPQPSPGCRRNRRQLQHGCSYQRSRGDSRIKRARTDANTRPLLLFVV